MDAVFLGDLDKEQKRIHVQIGIDAANPAPERSIFG